MIRLAVLGDENLIAERGEAERLNVEKELGREMPPFPASGGIQMSMRNAGRWYIDDDEPRTVMHAYLEDDGRVYVPLVYGPSETRLERLLWLAKDLFAAYGDRVGVFPDAGTPETEDAKRLIVTKREGSARSVRIADGITALEAAKRVRRGVG